jgi:CDP-6-deoxy-D-xylo-4-hexulose-3-dehydrase
MTLARNARIETSNATHPVPSVPYRVAANTLNKEEIDAAKAVLDSGMLTLGARVEAFERSFAAWTGAKHAVMVNSGSSANLLAIDLLLRRSRGEAPLCAGDEVLVPALAWPTTVWPLVQLGLTPVFVDVDPVTLAISLESAEAALSPRTKAMFLIQVLGLVPDMPAYTTFCRRHGLTLIEDSCESLGGHHAGTHVGNFGLCGTFSCYFSHHISTIEGGVIVTQDSALSDDLKSLRAHGWVRERSDKDVWKAQQPELDERFMFIMPGYNVRPTEIQAAIGSVQLRRLDEMLERRESLARCVDAWLRRSAPWLSLIGRERLLPDGTKRARRERTHSWMTLPMRLAADAPVTLAGLKRLFAEQQVETRPIIAGNLARHPGVRHGASRSAPSLEHSDAILAHGMMLGCHPHPAPGSLDTLERAIDALGRL